VRRTLAIGAGLALALAAVELGARIALRVRDRVHSGWHTRDAQRGMLQWVDERRLEQLAEEEAPPRDSMDEPSAVASPYVGVEYTAWFEDYPKEVEYFASEQGRNTFDILVLGGSVAAHLATDGDDTIQSILGGDARFRGRRIHIHNQGRGGYKAPQTSILGSLLFEMGYRPDMVILIDGFNEVALGNANRVAGAHPLYPSLGHWQYLQSGPTDSEATLDLLFRMHAAKQRMGGALAASLRWRLYYSAAATMLVDSAVERARARYTALADQYVALGGDDDQDPETEDRELDVALRGPELPADFESGLDAIVDIWVESSINLSGMCLARGIPFIHVLQPTFHDEGSKPRTQEELDQTEIDPHWLAGVVQGYPRLRDAGERLRAAGVHFFDGSRLFEEVHETLYYDCCHVMAPGSRILGRFCANRALEVLPAEVPLTPSASVDR
jgi:hypothetical protein